MQFWLLSNVAVLALAGLGSLVAARIDTSSPLRGGHVAHPAATSGGCDCDCCDDCGDCCGEGCCGGSGTAA